MEGWETDMWWGEFSGLGEGGGGLYSKRVPVRECDLIILRFLCSSGSVSHVIQSLVVGKQRWQYVYGRGKTKKGRGGWRKHDEQRIFKHVTDDHVGMFVLNCYMFYYFDTWVNSIKVFTYRFDFCYISDKSLSILLNNFRMIMKFNLLIINYNESGFWTWKI